MHEDEGYQRMQSKLDVEVNASFVNMTLIKLRNGRH